MEGRDDVRLRWLACHGGERCTEHEGHPVYASRVEGHKKHPATTAADQPDTADTGESTQDDDA